MNVTKENALGVAVELKKTSEGMLKSSTADNVTVSLVVKALEKFANVMMDQEEDVAQHIFACVNNLLETDRKIIEESERANMSATR